MSNSRMNSTIEPQNDDMPIEPKKPPSFTEEALKGAFIGICTTPFTFGFDRITVALQTSPNATFSEVLGMAWKNKFNSAIPTFLNSAVKKATLFWSFKASESILNHINPDSAKNDIIKYPMGAYMASMSTYPISVWKVLAYSDKPTREICRTFMNDKKRLFSGANTTALRDGIYQGTFFGIRKRISDGISQNLDVSGPVANMAGDLIAGAIGGAVSNPANVIAVNQKKDGHRFWPTAKKLYTEAGPRAFSRGIGLIVPRMCLQAVVTGAVIEAWEKNYQSSKPPGK